jgi:hypothetical protein
MTRVLTTRIAFVRVTTELVPPNKHFAPRLACWIREGFLLLPQPRPRLGGVPNRPGANWRVVLSDVRSPLACGAEQINGGHVHIPPLCGSTDSRFVTAYAQAALHLPESWTTLAFSTILEKDVSPQRAL